MPSAHFAVFNGLYTFFFKFPVARNTKYKAKSTLNAVFFLESGKNRSTWHGNIPVYYHLYKQWLQVLLIDHVELVDRVN